MLPRAPKYALKEKKLSMCLFNYEYFTDNNFVETIAGIYKNKF
jgi:hypothetical protein